MVSELRVALLGPLHDWDVPLVVGLVLAIAVLWVISIWPRKRR